MHFPYGDIVKEIPEGFAPPEMWPEISRTAGPQSFCSRELVGENPRGVRWSIWPLCFEEYVGDTEPDLQKSKEGSLARNRDVIWKRVARTDVPDGWRVGSKNPWRIDGFHVLDKHRDYTLDWFHNARRDLRMWKKLVGTGAYGIEEISFPEFSAAYKKSTVAKKFGLDLLRILERKQLSSESPTNSVLWGVKNTKTNEIIAGTAAHFSPSYRSSVRECPFMLPEARSAYASTGLMNKWFEVSMARGVKFQIFTFFWYKGKPRAWKSFSEFKSHFNLKYVEYPPELHRFVRGTLF